jgi:hypothetical protein
MVADHGGDGGMTHESVWGSRSTKLSVSIRVRLSPHSERIILLRNWLGRLQAGRAWKEPTMTQIDRRSALSLGIAATALIAAGKPTAVQTPAPQGVSRQTWGKRDAMIPGYKTVSMRDVVYQPGAKTSNPTMPNDMVCHVPEGELRVKQTGGMEMEFVAKKGDIWTCRKGTGEDLENIGSTVAIMRIIDLIA